MWLDSRNRREGFLESVGWITKLFDCLQEEMEVDPPKEESIVEKKPRKFNMDEEDNSD